MCFLNLFQIRLRANLHRAIICSHVHAQRRGFSFHFCTLESKRRNRNLIKSHQRNWKSTLSAGFRTEQKASNCYISDYMWDYVRHTHIYTHIQNNLINKKGKDQVCSIKSVIVPSLFLNKYKCDVISLLTLN